MTTGRINQVTTFPIRFRGCHLLACDPIAHFRDSEFIRPTSKTHRSSRTPSPRNEVQASLNPQMASPHFPLSHVSGEIPLSDVRTKVTHLPRVGNEVTPSVGSRRLVPRFEGKASL